MEVKKIVDSLASTDPKTQSLLLGAIAKQYLFMFIIDVENNSIQDIYAPEYVVDFAAQYSTASDALMAFSVGYTMDAYLEETIKFSTWDNIIYELNTKGMTFIECQSKFRTWCRISYIAMERDELGNLKKFIVLNQVLDEEKRQELVLLDELERAKIEGEIENNELKNKNRDISLVMTVLAEEYGNIYLVDPKDDTVEVIKQEDYISEAVDEGEYLSVTYNTAFKRYVESCVYHKDQEEIYQVGCLENIKKLLKTVDSYTHNYRAINNGLHYFQFTFNKIEDGRIVVGFRNIDSIIEY